MILTITICCTSTCLSEYALDDKECVIAEQNKIDGPGSERSEHRLNVC